VSGTFDFGSSRLPELVGSLVLIAIFFQGLRLWRGRELGAFVEERLPRRAPRRGLTSAALLFSLVAPIVFFVLGGGIQDIGPSEAAPPGNSVTLTKDLTTQFQAAGYGTGDISFTITPAVTANAIAQTVTVTNTTNVVVGSVVLVDSATAPETIVVSAVPSSTSITAIFQKSHLANSTGTNLNVQFPSDTVQLLGPGSVAATIPAGPFATGTPPTVGRGGHAIQGQSGLYLVVDGGSVGTTTIYDAVANAFTAGPTLAGACLVGSGAFSIQVAANTFLLVCAGKGDAGTPTPLKTVVITATPSTFTTVAGPNLTGATGAGPGAHAIKRGDGNFVVIHGGTTTGTSFVTAGASPTVSTGPTGIATNVGDGALSLPRAVDTRWFTLVGGGAVNTYLYDQSTSPGSFSAGTSAPVGYGAGAGAHALEYNSGACNVSAPFTCYRVFIGGATNKTATYNPAGAFASTTLVASGTTTANVGAGAFSVKEATAPNNYRTYLGGATTGSQNFTGATNLLAGPALPQNLGVGALAIQRPNGTYLVFLGGATSNTAVDDGGFVLRGSYTTEPLNPGNVNRWTQLSWVKTADMTITLRLRTATTSGGLSAAVYTDVATTSATTGTFALDTTLAPVANKWIQLQAVLDRGVPSSPNDLAGVWRGSGAIAYLRQTSTNPDLDSFALQYNLPEFLVTAAASQTAGAGFTATVALKDEAGSTVVDYAGTHTLVFSGANNAPDGTTPKVTNASAVDVAFGSGTTVTFASGVGTPTVKLFKQEGPVTICAQETTGTGSATTYTLTSTTIGCTGASVTVATGATSGATSTIAAAPPVVLANGTDTSTITVTLRDTWQNIAANRTVTVTLSSSRGGAETFTQPPVGGPTNASGQVTGTVRSSTVGTATISANAGGTPLAATVNVTFSASGFRVATQHSGTETANVAFTLTLTAVDNLGNTDATYSGSKTILFTSSATTRVTPKAGVAPTIPASQTATFTAGVATMPATFTLTNSGETPTITAQDQAAPTTQGSSAGLTVQVNVIDASHSELYVSPQPGGCLQDACIPADGSTTATIEARLYDVVNNPIPGRTVTFLSNRGGTDTFTQPGGSTSANGVATGTVRSLSGGDATITAQGQPRNPAGFLLAQDNSAVTISQSRVVHFAGVHFEITVNPSATTTVTAGVGFTTHLRILDENNSVLTTYTGNHTLTFTTTATARTSPAAGPAATIPSPQTINFVSGVADSLTGPSAFILYNSAQTPTLSVTEGVNFLGTTPSLTVTPAAASLADSLMSSSPGVASTSSGSSQITVTVTDAFHNPRSGFNVTVNTDGTLGTCGTCETLSPSAGPTFPANGTSDANGQFVATATSNAARTATYSASINGTGGANGTLTATAQVTWTTLTFADHFDVQVVFPNPPYAPGATQAIAGTAFRIVVTARNAANAALTTYCTTTCSLRVTHTAGTAPDGTSAPSPASGFAQTINGSNGPFVNGVWTSPAAYVTFYKAETARTITITDANQPIPAATGTSAAFDVVAATASASTSVVIATPRTVPADGSTVMEIRVRAKDAFQNPKVGTSVTLASDLGSFLDATTQSVGTDGLTNAIRLVSSNVGTANLSATPSGGGAITATTGVFSAPGFRVASGSYYGTSLNGTLTKYPLEVTAVCNGTCNSPNQLGHPLPSGTNVTWIFSSSDGGAGVFDDPQGGAAATSVIANGAYGSTTHRTAFELTKAGSVCVQARWQNPDASTTTVDVACGANRLFGVTIFDVVATEGTTGESITTRARAIWDGVLMRVVGWWSDH